jgi:hypothetical protein
MTYLVELVTFIRVYLLFKPRGKKLIKIGLDPPP